MKDGRIEKGLETKGKIIQATLVLISEQGLKGLSAQKIAQIAGVSKSNIFHHFGSVDVLPFEALKYISEIMLNSIKSGKYKTTKDLLIGIGEETFNLNPEFQGMFRAFFSLYNESFINPEYQKLLRRMYDEYAIALCQEIKEIEAINEDLNDFTQMITIIIDGFGLHFMSENNVNKYSKLWHMQVEMILQALKKYK